MSTPKQRTRAKAPATISTTDEDANSLSKSATKKSMRKAFVERQNAKRRTSILGSPAIRVAVVILGALLAFVISRPYWKPLPESQQKASFLPDPIVINNKDNPGQTYMVVDLPGKGKGMIAARHISRGELILKDRSLLRIPPHIEGEEPSDYIRRHVDSLTDEDREAFMSLSWNGEIHEDDVPLAIMQTNAFAAGEDMGVFPNAARLNHGCSSAFNAVYSWREEEGQLYVHALKDINAGDEILTTYTDTKKPRAERQRYLESQYHFKCGCDVCKLSDTLSAQSDARLSRMTELLDKLPAWNNDQIDGKQAIDIINEIWAIGEVEGYTSERGQLAADAALVATAHADPEAAAAWRRVAAQWFGYELGSGSQQVILNRMWAAKPDDHPAWNKKETPMSVAGPSDIVLGKPKDN